MTTSSGTLGQSLAFNAYQPPPAAPPAAQLATMALTPSASYWRINGTMRVQTPRAETDPVINDIPPEAWHHPVVHIKTDQIPLRVQMVKFIVGPPNYVPPSDDGDRFDCERPNRECAISSSGDAINVTLTSDLSPTTVLTLTAEYATLEAADEKEGIYSYTQSWVIRGRL